MKIYIYDLIEILEAAKDKISEGGFMSITQHAKIDVLNDLINFFDEED